MFLGIEIGGTKLQLGVGPGDGTIVAIERAKVDAAGGAERIRQQIIELVPVLLSRAGLSRADILAVGFGFGGPVDADRGIVTKSHQIEGWAGFPLADWSRRELGWPTVVHNDADTAGLAEACFGAGRGYSPIFYITIGSGIGGGLIIDQKIYRGAGAGAGEIGHLRIAGPVTWRPDLPSKELAPRLQDTLESACSGWAMESRMRRELEVFAMIRNEDTKQLYKLCGEDPKLMTVEVITQAAKLGNLQAQANIAFTCKVLGWAIAQLIALVCPRLMVIGGGVSLIGQKLFFEPLRRETAAWVFAPFADCYEIVPAALGEAVVVHGALRLARDSTGNDRSLSAES